jgi:FAD/FMN-containing dehydrogenase
MSSATLASPSRFTGPSGIACLTDEAARRAYRSDHSGRAGRMPSAILQPTCTADVQAIVQWARRSRTGLVPVSSSAGPRRRGDTVCEKDSVIVDLSGMRRIVHVDGADAVAIVEAGVRFPELEAALRPHGLRALKPLLPRASKSVLASHLEREPITVPHLHWDSADPLAAMEVVFGTGDVFRTGSASLPGTLEENLARGNRQLISFGPGHTDFGRVIQGAQGSLAIASWGSVYCERIPAVQTAWFAVADTLEPLVQLCSRQLWRRAGSQLYIVNDVQLALMLATNATHFKALQPNLPPWMLLVELTASDYFAEEAMQYQHADLQADADAAGARLTSTLGAGVTAAAVSALRDVHHEAAYKSRAHAAHQDVFFLSQLGKAAQHLRALAPMKLDPATVGIYLQPMTQGVNAHCEFTFLGDDDARLRRRAREAAERCAESGAFFSRPCHPFADLAFARDATVGPLLQKTKRIFDPDAVLQPASQALGLD